MLMEFYEKNKVYVVIIGTILLCLTIAWFSGAFEKNIKNEPVESTDEQPLNNELNATEVNKITKQLSYLQRPIENLENTGETIKVYNFNTSWCRYSVMFAPEWSKFMSLVENNNKIEAFDVKCDSDSNKEFCSTFSVRGYPSVVIVKDGKQIEYPGPRNAEKILEYVNQL